MPFDATYSCTKPNLKLIVLELKPCTVTVFSIWKMGMLPRYVLYSSSSRIISFYTFEQVVTNLLRFAKTQTMFFQLAVSIFPFQCLTPSLCFISNFFELFLQNVFQKGEVMEKEVLRTTRFTEWATKFSNCINISPCLILSGACVWWADRPN